MTQIPYAVSYIERKPSNRGLFVTDMQDLVSATIIFENGDFMGVSRWPDENYWVVDSAFKANGYPLFSNGVGSRVTAGRALPEDQTGPLDTALENL